MNKTYRNIWNATTRTWTAVAETAKSHSKGSSRAARQAVIAIALGGAVIGSAAAADVCTTADGASGTVDDAGVCRMVNQSEIGTMGSIGTMAGGWSSGNGISAWAGSGTAANAATASDISIGNGSSALGGTSTALGNGATVGTSAGTAIGANSTSTASYGLAIGAATRTGRGAVVEGTGSVAIGTITHVTSDANNAVALGMGSVAHEANTISVGAGIPNIDGATFTRRIVNVSAGTADTDAVNLGQMNAGLSTTNASIAATNTALSTTNTSLASTNTNLSTTNATLAATNTALSTAQTTIATHTTQIDNLNNQLNELSDGTVGLVQQSAAGADLTVGANTDGAAVNFAGTAGDRKLTGVANGTAASDAVNFGQLSATNAVVDATKAELSTTNVSLASTQTELSTTNAQVATLDSDMTTAKGNIATHTADIATINDQLAGLSDGSIGLVQQSAAGADLTVGANTDGAAVNFAGTAGDRKLTGVANGTADADAVNFSQLSTTNAAIDATNAELSTTNVSLASTNTALSTTNAHVAALDSDMTTAKGNIATHTADIATINDQLAGLSDGTVGLVQQSAAGADLTVGANTDGAAVNFAGMAGDRKLAGVAAGTTDSDAVNFGQLSATNAAVDATNAGLSTTNVSLASTQTELSTAQTTIATHTTQIDTINNQLNELSDGTIGLVQQSAAGADLTVGANNDGAAVNFAGTAGDRKLTGIAAGTADSDAVNFGQLSATNAAVDATKAELSSTNVSLASTNAELSTTNVSLASTNAALSTAQTTIATHTTQIDTINDQLNELSDGTIGLVQQSAVGADLTVGANTDGAAVNFAGTAGDRKLTGVAAGTADSDAVNFGQLSATNAAVDATKAELSSTNVSLASTNAELSTTNVSLASTQTELSTAQTTIATHTTQIDTINDQLNELSDGTIGLVQQSAAGADLTVGANTDGAAVNFAGTAGDRKLTGVANGTADSDAVNFGQLSATNAAVDATKAELSTTNVSLASTQTDLSTAQTTIATHTTQIDTINDQLNELSDGTIGLVQQSAAGADLTVGANTDGAAVNFAGTAGNRKLTGIAAGDVSAASTEAVNGSQLHGVADSVASAIGGGSTVNADGSLSAPSFTVGDGSGGTKIVSTVGDVVTNLNDRVTSNEGGIKNLAEQLSSGTVGLVQQDATSGMITVGAGGAGSVVNFAGSGGPRVLTGVANGVHDDDVVTVSQLRATGLIDYTGKEVGAVTYDSGLSFDTVTFAGTDGTVLRQVAAGMISATSMEAVNGSQLYALQEQFAKQYDDLSNRYDDLSGRVGELETSPGPSDPGTGGPGAGGPGTGDGSTVVGEGADASGKNSSAIGNGSVASGDNSSAIGNGSVASGDNSTAVGQGSVASGEGSTAIGQGSTASGNNSVAIGQGSVATEANTVSFGDGTAEGNRRLVNIADGINASDAATKGQLDRAMESVDQRFNDTNRAINDVAKNAYAGIAAAMAMPNMTPSQPGKTVVAVGAANFKSGSAIAAGATYRSRNGNWLVNGATSVTSVGDVGIRAQVGYEF
ncbi:putative hemagglutinin-related autotransporter protein [Burkholderia lata]|uniref:Putative hemagglutinin-related autotransporter protein n=1 Tax=Burkholderia lata (strain ATCC 17760 / DSM 23089 / LMG 22485 / NCIMB 9086 / R18194 / 383) TaxID=482957 RepID=A0A6P2H7H4_BURL3|nr:ESPR-type extended signal peptide-containing protein [Burkholderia lata]VWB13129.1 putative hemagglutinin-related autotransporter protein [Burkholderia lata]